MHGFRPIHSTISALLLPAHNIAQSFNQPLPPSRTLIMAIDIFKGFDLVNHKKLISAFILSSLNNNTKQMSLRICLNAYLYHEQFHITIHWIYHHSSLISNQYIQSACWHQLGLNKGNYPSFLQIPNPTSFYLCRSHICFANASSSLCNPISHWLYQNESLLSMISFPYYVPNIPPIPSNLTTISAMWSPPHQVSETWNTP